MTDTCVGIEFEDADFSFEVVGIIGTDLFPSLISRVDGIGSKVVVQAAASPVKVPLTNLSIT